MVFMEQEMKSLLFWRKNVFHTYITIENSFRETKRKRDGIIVYFKVDWTQVFF